MVSNETMQKACYLAENYIEKLSIMLDDIGKLDDVFETPYIDDRINKGAYQCITSAILRLDDYIMELQFQMEDNKEK